MLSVRLFPVNEAERSAGYSDIKLSGLRPILWFRGLDNQQVALIIDSQLSVKVCFLTAPN
ncbi:hypothetical protein J6590_037687 [Homalodisca vitripennis]|nr:hypothetical protein J6590_037687 [Homalodisca vitripennis]